MEFIEVIEDESRRPEDTPFRQQRLKNWQPKIGVNGLVIIYFIFAFIFIPVGIHLLRSANSISEYEIQYDGHGTEGDNKDCMIDASYSGKKCEIKIKFKEDAMGPFFVFYQLHHFYQNNRRYIKSHSAGQLSGMKLSKTELEGDCYPMSENGTLLLNPCGLVANTMFTDIITIHKSPKDVELDKEGISWFEDWHDKYRQVDGFEYKREKNTRKTCQEVFGHDTKYDTCKVHLSDNDSKIYYFWYPDDNNVQYLYETYPGIISPLEGVESELFVNWMRSAGLPNFRKLYGKIDSDFKEGDEIIFRVDLNYEVNSFDGKKFLVVTNMSNIGTKNRSLGNAFFLSGILALALGCMFSVKRMLFPRPHGDIRQLAWSTRYR